MTIKIKDTLPWEITTRKEKHEYPHIAGKNEYGSNIPICDLCLTGLEWEAASFIKNACNSNSILVNALKLAISALNQIPNTKNNEFGTTYKLIPHIQEALKEVK